MSQKITSLYKLVTIPVVYELIQRTLGQKKTRNYLCNGPLKTNTGDRVLDVGCGPATLRPFLGDIHYQGMDLNPEHIEHATKNFGHLGVFICSNAVTDILNAPGPYDLIYCIGLLHHLDDDEAKTLINSLSARLADGGRLVTYDPVYIENQNIIAKWLNDLDSGQNVRTAQGYASLFDGIDLPLDTQVLSGMLNVPYNHCCNIVSHPK